MFDKWNMVAMKTSGTYLNYLFIITRKVQDDCHEKVAKRQRKKQKTVLPNHLFLFVPFTFNIGALLSAWCNFICRFLSAINSWLSLIAELLRNIAAHGCCKVLTRLAKIRHRLRTCAQCWQSPSQCFSIYGHGGWSVEFLLRLYWLKLCLTCNIWWTVTGLVSACLLT